MKKKTRILKKYNKRKTENKNKKKGGKREKNPGENQETRN
jgi:hypothetical protein